MDERLKIMGAHLDKLVTEKYGKRSNFGRAYLERKQSDKDIGEISTWLYKITSGRQRMKLDDLKTFSELLGVSCQELLLGKTMKEETPILDNYSVAKSDDESIWETYLKLPEGPALYKDSYGKSLLDYAVEFQNLRLFHYMVDRGYLNLASDFSLGSKIPRMVDLHMEAKHTARYDFWMKRWEVLPVLREDIIQMANECGDLKVLDKMHAKETQGQSYQRRPTAEDNNHIPSDE